MNDQTTPTPAAMRAAAALENAYDIVRPDWPSHVAEIIDRETGLAGLIEACEELAFRFERVCPDAAGVICEEDREQLKRAREAIRKAKA